MTPNISQQTISLNTIDPNENNEDQSTTERLIPNYGISRTFSSDTISNNSRNLNSTQDSPLNNAETQSSWLSDFSTPINPIPDLAKPTVDMSRLEKIPNTRFKRLRERDRFTITELEEIIPFMNNLTLQKIRMTLFVESAQINKEDLGLSGQLIEMYNAYKKNREEIQESVYQALLKDEKLVARLKTPSKIAGLAATICGLAAGLISLGISSKISDILQPIIGDVFDYSIKTLAAAAPFTTIACVGFKSVEGYLDYHSDQAQSQHILAQHEETYYDRLANECFESIQNCSSRDSREKKRYADHLKNDEKLKKLIRSR